METVLFKRESGMATALEAELNDLFLQDDSVKPGLFHLSLNLLYQPDTDTLKERKKLLDFQLEEEHPIFHLILKNLIALINYRLPRRHTEVIYILESIRKKNPKHLNTLANLEVVYKEHHQRSESDSCKKEKEVILRGNNSEAKELRAQCVLEQALTLAIEDATNHEGIAHHRIKDALTILSSEFGRSSGERQEYLGKALRYAEQASSCVLNALVCKTPNETIERKKDTIEMFLQGLNMLESIGKEKTVEYHIWMYCFGMALEKYHYPMSQEDSRQVTGIELNTKILHIFWNTICNLDDKGQERTYIARSYAFLGSLLISRKYAVEKIVKSKALSVDKQSQLIELVKNPLECFQPALTLRTSDVHVRNRFGKSLKLKSRFESSDCDKNVIY